MIKIVGGPRPHQVKVFVIKDDGEEIDITANIQSISWCCNAADSLARVTLGIPFGVVDVTGQLEELLSQEVVGPSEVKHGK